MANLLTDYAHAVIQEGEMQRVRRMSMNAMKDLEKNELRNQMKMSSSSFTSTGSNSPSTVTLESQQQQQQQGNGGVEAPPRPPPPPPPPPKRNSVTGGVQLMIPAKNESTSTKTAVPFSSSSSSSSSTSTPQSAISGTAAGSRLSVRGQPTAPPPPPPPIKPSNRPQSERVTSMKLQYTPYHHQCATIIQSNYRGYALRNEWIREDSAILIQAAYRGYAERCRVSLMLEELYRSGQLEILDDDEK